ncbi:unnamed protein product [Pylaiella littoralis]
MCCVSHDIPCFQVRKLYIKVVPPPLVDDVALIRVWCVYIRQSICSKQLTMSSHSLTHSPTHSPSRGAFKELPRLTTFHTTSCRREWLNYKKGGLKENVRRPRRAHEAAVR